MCWTAPVQVRSTWRPKTMAAAVRRVPSWLTALARSVTTPAGTPAAAKRPSAPTLGRVAKPPGLIILRAIAGGRVCTHQGLTRHFGMSSNARGLTENDLTGKPAEFATPSVLLRLAKAHDRMFTY